LHPGQNLPRTALKAEADKVPSAAVSNPLPRAGSTDLDPTWISSMTTHDFALGKIITNEEKGHVSLHVSPSLNDEEDMSKISVAFI